MSPLSAAVSFVAREVDVFFGFSWRDWSTTLIPGSIFAVGAMREAKQPPLTTLANYLFLVSWLTPYIYFFNLSNQITGVSEDRIDKPDRPIPSGKVTLRGAKIRWAFALAWFVGVSLYERGLLPPMICWVATVAFLCLTPGGSHWFGKNNIAMTTGTWALLTASWVAIAPVTPISNRYILAVSNWAGLITHIQDLRDIKGDAAIGRKTMPLVFGDMNSRYIISFLLLPAAFGVLHWGGVISLAPYTLAAYHIFLGYRILNPRGPRYDHKTYMIYTYLFCLLLAFTATKGLDAELLQLGRSLIAQTSHVEF